MPKRSSEPAPEPKPRPKVEVDPVLWRSICFTVRGMAIMGTVKHDHPTLHQWFVDLARCLDEQHPEKAIGGDQGAV